MQAADARGLAQPAAISVTDSDEVLVAMTASGAMRFSSRASVRA